MIAYVHSSTNSGTIPVCWCADIDLNPGHTTLYYCHILYDTVMYFWIILYYITN